ncbi:hypothetical protein ACFUCH_12260 [Streptomyces olivaceus]|uniref:hypothetical protein n=1 Tax=Streptomyces olivaceus TaxID=47716 RepID=UPI00363074C9
MNTISELLSATRQLDEPAVPADVIGYDEDYAMAPPAHHEDEGEANEANEAGEALSILCETTIGSGGPLQADDFLTDRLPDIRGAWILGCAVYLTGEQHGARFWWQYAAGADHGAASSNAAYCLHLMHRAAGEEYAARFWRRQTHLESQLAPEAITTSHPPAPQLKLSFDSSIPALLRILANLRSASLHRTSRVSRILNYLADTVTNAYAHHPDVEYQVPPTAPGFADEVLLACKSSPPPNSSNGPHGTRRNLSEGPRLPVRDHCTPLMSARR